MRPEDFFGTLQDSITAEWRKHLQADNNDVHTILDTFYKEMPELVDALIEAWQADHDVVKDYNNMLDAKQVSALAFLEELKNFTKNGRSELLNGESELESLCDDILAQIDSTIYKLKRLTKEGQKNESRKMKTLVQFIKESMNNESEFVLVEPIRKAYDELLEEMADAMIHNQNGDPDLFVLRMNVAKDLKKKYKDDVTVWAIPNGDLETFESDYEDGKFDYTELEEIKF